MAPIPTGRCPSCGVLTALDQSICIRCLGPLPAYRAAEPAAAMTDETCHLYRASAANVSLVFFRTTIEYTAPEIAFTTAWNNVATITHTANSASLMLYQTPNQIRLPLGNSHTWFSDITRSIPLQPFGYPNNDALYHDLCAYAPHVRRFIHVPPDLRG